MGRGEKSIQKMLKPRGFEKNLSGVPGGELGPASLETLKKYCSGLAEIVFLDNSNITDSLISSSDKISI